GDAGAGAAVQARPAPDLPPGIAGDEVLEVGGELGGGGRGPVDVGVAEHGPPDGHALVVSALVVHAVTSDGEEGGLLVALQGDGEAAPVVPVGEGDQPGPDLRVRDRGQQGVGGVGVGLVGEVDAGHQ